MQFIITGNSFEELTRNLLDQYQRMVHMQAGYDTISQPQSFYYQTIPGQGSYAGYDPGRGNYPSAYSGQLYQINAMQNQPKQETPVQVEKPKQKKSPIRAAIDTIMEMNSNPNKSKK